MDIFRRIAFRAVQKGFYIASFFLNWNEPELLKGAGAVRSLAKKIKEDGFTSVLIVTDKGLMKLNLLLPLFEGLDENNIKYSVYDGTEPNPTFDNVQKAYEIYKESGSEAIIAFGGGSPMDCAKGVGIRAARPTLPLEHFRGYLKVRRRIPYLYAVPTTAGTGSETTIATVLTNSKTHEKFAINDLHLRPKCAVLDPELTLLLPPHITSTTGMDALTHAVEAYIGKSNTKDTKESAEKAVKIIFDNIEKVYKDGSDITARENMLEASYYAGLAFTRAYVGYVHAIAHNLGGMYKTAHGFANAVLLPYVVEYYGKSAHKKLARLAEVSGLDTSGKSTSEKAKLFIEAIRELNEKLDIPSKFDMIKESDIKVLSERAYKEGNPMYPVPRMFTRKEFEDIIRQVKE
ncbi:MAG TPA: iron-containing alcohol dehydrogenase [Oscillospiraceae bacterium]|nr:iron-containing alcohol dehydrogenase [Oscillospiraceae bacterium]